ncbi:2-phosphosulfolactate phosphatase [Alkalihalophilus lindianensis]|uniref:Probable 2-phosphosulfolactate phosphatase n=1 Tax=Alkalihalophilus lindianensis TaxID=1630542 RepID=A0ABU3X5D8_9BACI|nr:2-phosphosulfolactate phosphatase [Alkalihalophilus lindianensis]MDV2683105.1 2-phosphosulfolactate phosphatase [Alkalihalophilus lindianensis]
MTHVHVLLKKEEIEPEKLAGEIVIVLDVLLATSTIAFALSYGAKAVIPVSSEEEAIKLSTNYHPDDFILVGEKEGRVIDGFLSPNPSLLKSFVQGKVVILATTNGTVALNRSEGAEMIYPACLRNGEAVIEDITTHLNPGQKIIIVCSGSSNQFCLEDFYGAGYLVSCLREKLGVISINDAGIAAEALFLTDKQGGYDLLIESAVGRFIIDHGFEEDVREVVQVGVDLDVPIYQNKKIFRKGVVGSETNQT